MRQSFRLEAVQSPIIPVVGQMIRDHPGTISLGQGVVSYGPPREAVDALAEFWSAPEPHKYKPVEGINRLHDAIVQKLAADNGVNVGPGRRVVVTAGGNMGFVNALLAIADLGDELILPRPYYFNHEMAIAMAGCRAVSVPTDEGYQLQPDAIAAAIAPRTRAVVTISPNNPSGAVYGQDSLRRINRLCAQRGIYHISDEAYEYFTYNGVGHFSPCAIDGGEAFTIGLYSLSKSYGFASWRIGYMVIPEHLLEAIRKIQDTILICPPLISQYAAAGAMRAGGGYCRAKLRDIEEVRRIVLGELAATRSFCDVPRADGAFYFLLRVHTGRRDMELVEELVRRFGVAVIPGGTFGMADGCYLRVAYGALERETAAQGIGRLVRGLKELVR
jgi:aspartate/methionine/tyrosine aminotransferase